MQNVRIFNRIIIVTHSKLDTETSMKYFLFLFLFPMVTNAKVISSNTNGFTIQIERSVNVDAITAYEKFLNIGSWWNPEHTYFGDSRNLSIIPAAGGCFCEIDGEKQVLHMTVSYVEPNKEIRMLGGLGPLQMMGVYGGMSWKFENHGANQTKIIHRYQVSGSIEGGMSKLADIVDRVQQTQINSLVAKLQDNE